MSARVFLSKSPMKVWVATGWTGVSSSATPRLPPGLQSLSVMVPLRSAKLTIRLRLPGACIDQAVADPAVGAAVGVVAELLADRQDADAFHADGTLAVAVGDEVDAEVAAEAVGVVAGAAKELVVAGAAVEAIAVGATQQLVGTGSAFEGVVATAAEQVIRAFAAQQVVGAGLALEVVTTPQALQLVVAGATVEVVGPAKAIELLTDRAAEDHLTALLGLRRAEHDLRVRALVLEADALDDRAPGHAGGEHAFEVALVAQGQPVQHLGAVGEVWVGEVQCVAVLALGDVGLVGKPLLVGRAVCRIQRQNLGRGAGGIEESQGERCAGGQGQQGCEVGPRRGHIVSRLDVHLAAEGLECGAVGQCVDAVMKLVALLHQVPGVAFHPGRRFAGIRIHHDAAQGFEHVLEHIAFGLALRARLAIALGVGGRLQDGIERRCGGARVEHRDRVLKSERVDQQHEAVGVAEIVVVELSTSSLASHAVRMPARHRCRRCRGTAAGLR